MKNRLITIVMALLCASSLAFADNPTDAPLVADAGYVATCRDNKVEHNARRTTKKDESASAKSKQQNDSRNDGQEASSSEYSVNASN